MAIDNTTRKTVVMLGDGSSVDFPFAFRINNEEDLKVYVKIGVGAYTLQTLNDDYELVDLHTDANGNITSGNIRYPKLGTPLTSADSIYAIRETPNTQLEDSSQVSFQSKDMERALDKATMEIQELAEDVSRCIKTEAWQDIDPNEILDAIYQSEADAASAASDAYNSELAAAASASNASTSETNAQKWAEGSDADVSALGGTHSAKGWANAAASSASNAAESATAAQTAAGSCADKSLSNLNATGEARFTAKANTDLSNASTTTAILNTVFPAAVDYVIETQLPTSSNNYTWYRKYRSGWIEQGGRLAGGSGSYTGTVNLSKEMADTYYNLSIIALTTGGGVYSCIKGTITTTSFIYSANDSPDNGFSWEVKGQGA